jgi:hypothetical protein
MAKLGLQVPTSKLKAQSSKLKAQSSKVLLFLTEFSSQHPLCRFQTRL